MTWNLQSMKERKLFQWALAYLAGGWLLLQVLDLIGHKFHWPDTIGRIAIVLMGVGFLAVLVLAWFHGEKGQQKVSTLELVMLAGILMLAGAAVFLVRKDVNAGADGATSATSVSSTPAGNLKSAARTSIAVLPFESMSADPDNAYFASGIHDELLTRLAKLGSLKVISRTSVMAYKGHTKTLRQIGQELGVGSVVEGSVQRSGQKVRVQAQLIDAATDEHIWADHFDGDLSDIFAIQTQIAEKIANQLQASLTVAEKGDLQRKPTTNAEAYDAFLRAEEYLRQAISEHDDSWNFALDFYGRAIKLDPAFALAHARLSYTHGQLNWLGVDATAARIAKQRAEAERALQLQPDLPEAHIAMGYVYYWGMRDYDRALAEFGNALREWPNHADLHAAIALVHRRQGKFEQSISEMTKALELDPRNFDLFQQQCVSYRYLRQFDAAIRTCERSIAIAPDNYAAVAGRADALFASRGDLSGVRASRTRTALANFYATRLERDKARALAIALAVPDVNAAYGSFVTRGHMVGWAKSALGDAAGARVAFDSARVQTERALRSAPQDPRMHIALGMAFAGLGRKAEALAESKRVSEIMPVSKDALLGTMLMQHRAEIHAQAGDADGAIALIQTLLKIPSLLNVPELRIDPIWDPIRNDPRFQALIK